MECGTKNATDIVYCGHCGNNLAEASADLARGYEKKIAAAEQLRLEGRYYEALCTLRGIVSKGDSRLDHFAETARRLYEEVTELRAQKTAEASVALANAQAQVKAQNYAAAKSILDRVPIGVRKPEMNQTLQDIESTMSKVQSLTDHIKAAMQEKKYDHLLPYVQQLRELNGGDPTLNRLAEQLKQRQDQLNISTAQRQLSRAKEHFAQFRYLEAADELAGLERVAIPAKWHSTYDMIMEMAWLARQLRSSPFATPHLLRFASRLRKLSPEDPSLIKLLAQVSDRLQRPAQDPRFANAWGKLPETTSIGYPVRPWQGFRQVEGVEDFDELQRDPVRFLVAYGLALQGLGLARLSPNLLGRQNSLRQRFATLRQPAMLNSVWGIDLGTTGLKAIELSRDKPTAPPQVTNAVSVVHQTPLNEVSKREDVVQITQATLRSLWEQIPTSRGKSVVSFSGPKSLGRYFEIPKFKGKKLVDAITYEARMQIPIPINEIQFDWHAWEDDEGSSRFVGITLLAARKDQIAETLAAFEGAPTNPIAVQSCCLALYNAAFYEFWRDLKGDAEPVAILDVGAEASTLIVGSPTQIRYRSLAIGTEKMNRLLMTRFNLTRQQAAKAREQWSVLRWMYQIDEELSPLYRDFAAQVRRTLVVYQNEGIPVQQLLVTGGGAGQYGLLRHFVHGDANQYTTITAD